MAAAMGPFNKDRLRWAPALWADSSTASPRHAGGHAHRIRGRTRCAAGIVHLEGNGEGFGHSKSAMTPSFVLGRMAWILPGCLEHTLGVLTDGCNTTLLPRAPS